MLHITVSYVGQSLTVWALTCERLCLSCTDTNILTACCGCCSEADTWLNDPAVREALHAAPKNWTGSWQLCSKRIHYRSDGGSMLPIHNSLVRTHGECPDCADHAAQSLMCPFPESVFPPPYVDPVDPAAICQYACLFSGNVARALSAEWIPSSRQATNTNEAYMGPPTTRMQRFIGLDERQYKYGQLHLLFALAMYAGLRALIYSGDHDMAVPHTGTEAWTAAMHKSNATECAEVNISNNTELVKQCDGTTTPWQAWYNSEVPAQVSAVPVLLGPAVISEASQSHGLNTQLLLLSHHIVG